MIGLVREAGGFGDVICMSAAARVCKREWPNEEVYVFLPEGFCGVGERLVGVDRVISLGPLKVIRDTPRRRRDTPLDADKYSYLRPLTKWPDARYVDIFCPGFLYETTEANDLHFSRSQMFAIATGAKKVLDAAPRWRIEDRDRDQAERMLQAVGIDIEKDLFFTIQTRGTCQCRSLPQNLRDGVLSQLSKIGKVFMIDSVQPNPPVLSGVASGIMWPFHVLAAVADMSRLCITVDSMLCHLAVAVQTRAVCIFGPTDGVNTIRSYPGHVAVEASRVIESPCNYNVRKGWKRDCRETGCRRMLAVTEEMVMSKVEELLNESPSSQSEE